APNRTPADIGRARRTPSENKIQATGTDRWSLAWSLQPDRPASFNSQRFATRRSQPICIKNLCRASIFDQGERDGGRQRLEQTKGSGDSEGRLLYPSAGTVRP